MKRDQTTQLFGIMCIVITFILTNVLYFLQIHSFPVNKEKKEDTFPVCKVKGGQKLSDDIGYD